MLKKVHPDKGGKKLDAQKLQAAKEEWDKARKTGKVGRPKQTKDKGADLLATRRKEYRVCASMVLLTYQGF